MHILWICDAGTGAFPSKKKYLLFIVPVIASIVSCYGCTLYCFIFRAVGFGIEMCLWIEATIIIIIFNNFIIIKSVAVTRWWIKCYYEIHFPVYRSYLYCYYKLYVYWRKIEAVACNPPCMCVTTYHSWKSAITNLQILQLNILNSASEIT